MWALAQLDWQPAYAVRQCLRQDVPLQPKGVTGDGWTVSFDDLACDVDDLSAILRHLPLHSAVVDVGISRRHRRALMPQELLNDALILLTAAKAGLAVLTSDRDHYDLLQQLCPEARFVVY